MERIIYLSSSFILLWCEHAPIKHLWQHFLPSQRLGSERIVDRAEFRQVGGGQPNLRDNQVGFILFLNTCNRNHIHELISYPICGTFFHLRITLEILQTDHGIR